MLCFVDIHDVNTSNGRSVTTQDTTDYGSVDYSSSINLARAQDLELDINTGWLRHWKGVFETGEQIHSAGPGYSLGKQLLMGINVPQTYTVSSGLFFMSSIPKYLSVYLESHTYSKPNIFQIVFVKIYTCPNPFHFWCSLYL